MRETELCNMKYLLHFVHFVQLIHYSLFSSYIIHYSSLLLLLYFSFISLHITHVISVCVNKNVQLFDGARSYSGGPAETLSGRPA